MKLKLISWTTEHCRVPSPSSPIMTPLHFPMSNLSAIALSNSVWASTAACKSLMLSSCLSNRCWKSLVSFSLSPELDCCFRSVFMKSLSTRPDPERAKLKEKQNWRKASEYYRRTGIPQSTGLCIVKRKKRHAQAIQTFLSKLFGWKLVLSISIEVN